MKAAVSHPPLWPALRDANPDKPYKACRGCDGRIERYATGWNIPDRFAEWQSRAYQVLTALGSAPPLSGIGKGQKAKRFQYGAPGRTRTSTMLPPPDFESGLGGFPSIPLVSWACKIP